MKILIAFYSWTGHTETVARALGQKLESTIIRIEPLVGPDGRMGRMAMKTLFGIKEEIKPVQADLTEIDHLVIATPVWMHNLPPFTRQYLSGLNGCTGKKFSILTEMGGSGSERVVKNIRRILEGKGMKFVASAATIEKDVDAGKFDETLDEFAKKVQTG